MNFLKAYGALHTEEKTDVMAPPIELASISLQASPGVLRELSTFLSHCADRLEASGSTDPMVHFHLQDEWDQWDLPFPDVIVVAPSI